MESKKEGSKSTTSNFKPANLIKNNLLVEIYHSIQAAKEYCVDLFNKMKKEDFSSYLFKQQVLDEKSGMVTEKILGTFASEEVSKFTSAWNNGVNTEYQSGQNITYSLEPLLHTVVKKNWIDAADLFLKKETNPNLYSYISSSFSSKETNSAAIVNGNFQKEQTALHIAVENDNLEMTRLLVGNKAHINVTAKKDPPLVLCCVKDDKKDKPNRKKIAELLLQHNANINAKGPSNRSPLRAAVECLDNSAIIELLLNNDKTKLSAVERGEVEPNSSSAEIINLDKQRRSNNQSLAKLLLIKNKVSNTFINNPDTARKIEVWESFILFFKGHLTYSPEKMVTEWVKKYASEREVDKNPFMILQIQRRQGITSIFNPKYTRSTKAFLEYLGKKEIPEFMSQVLSSSSSNEERISESTPLVKG